MVEARLSGPWSDTSLVGSASAIRPSRHSAEGAKTYPQTMVNATSSSAFRIGNQTAFWAPTLVPFTYAIEQGFQAFEFFPDGKPEGPGWTATDLTPSARATIAAKAREHGIRLSVHASIAANPLTTAGKRILERDIELARDLGACTVVVHAVPAALAHFARAVMPLVQGLADAGMVLSIENTVAASPEDFNTLFAHLWDLDANRVRSIGACVDIGHANLYSGTRNDYLAWLDRLSDSVPIVHVHAHENRGDRDSHMTLFTGRAAEDPSGVEGLVRRLARRHFEGSIILEQWPEPSGLLVEARDRLSAIVQSLASEERRPCGVSS